MTQETVMITDDIRKFEEENIRIEYYTLDGKHPELYMCPGDLMMICNVLHDYASLLEELLKSFPEQLPQFLYEYHAGRCRKIQYKIENEMGYSTEKAIEKCRKRQGRMHKDDNVGEDAMVLAVRRRKEHPAPPAKDQEHNETSKPVSKGDVTGQINLLDLLGR